MTSQARPPKTAAPEVSAALQLPLPLSGDPEMTLDQYVAEPQVLARLEALADGRATENTWLCGASGLGKSHLLMAICACADQAGRRSGFLAAADLAAAGPDCLESLNGLDLVAVDDLDQLLSARWQEAWFHRINRWRDQGCQQVFSASVSVRALEFELRDLQSRLRAMTELRLTRPTPEAQAEILRRRARARGISLGDDVVAFILRRQQRGAVRLVALLDHLSEQSLIAKRRITVPFVRELLNRSTD